MSGDKAMTLKVVLGVPLVIAASAATAQSGFGGSFDTPAPNAQQPPSNSDFGGNFSGTPQLPPAPGGGGFGGSFDSGGRAPAPVAPPQGQAPAPGGDNFGGTFGTNEQPQVTQQPPTYQPPPVVNAQPPTYQPPSVGTLPQPNQQPPNSVAIDTQIFAFEARDFGVQPTNQLRQSQMHAPTPTAVPGASAVSTAALAGAIASGQQLLLIDVLGGQYSLPRALVAPALASPGSLNDRVQQQASQWLSQITGGRRDLPIVIYCSDPHCWLSYNAVLRTVAAGYDNVYWYRGGITAWQMAGLQVMPSGM